MDDDALKSRIRETILATDPLPEVDLDRMESELAARRRAVAAAGAPPREPSGRRLRAAAAAGLIALGFALGLLFAGSGIMRSSTVLPPAAQLPPAPRRTESALAVQQLGSDLVQHLAAIGDRPGDLPREELQAVRESTLAVLHGATVELRRLDAAAPDPALVTVDRLLAGDRARSPAAQEDRGEEDPWQVTAVF